MKVFRPFILLAAFILIVGLACSVNLTDEPTAQPIQPSEPVLPQEQPTERPALATEAPAATDEPAPTAEPVSLRFFAEEFDSEPASMWNYFVIGPASEKNEEKVDFSFDYGKMIFKVNASDLYAYYLYDEEVYEDVRVDIRFENRGVNSQQTSLICRYSDEGWYEFSVQSDGLWVLWAVTKNSDGKSRYNRVVNGGSTNIKQGKATNEYGMTCQGDKIYLYINGEEVKQSPIAERKYALRRGTAGLNVSSLNAFPVVVEIDWFKISEP